MACSSFTMEKAGTPAAAAAAGASCPYYRRRTPGMAFVWRKGLTGLCNFRVKAIILRKTQRCFCAPAHDEWMCVVGGAGSKTEANSIWRISVNNTTTSARRFNRGFRVFFPIKIVCGPKQCCADGTCRVRCGRNVNEI